MMKQKITKVVEKEFSFKINKKSTIGVTARYENDKLKFVNYGVRDNVEKIIIWSNPLTTSTLLKLIKKLKSHKEIQDKIINQEIISAKNCKNHAEDTVKHYQKQLKREEKIITEKEDRLQQLSEIKNANK